MYTFESIAHEIPELSQIIIKNKALRIRGVILPNLGATLQQYALKNVEILDGIFQDQNGLDTYNNKFNSAFLFPFFGRIPKGEYQYRNKKYQFPCNSADGSVALHGHLYNKKFEITQQKNSENQAEITLEHEHDGTIAAYPFPYKIQIRYIFINSSLSIEFLLNNTGSSSLPFGLGWHPYFKTGSLHQCELNFKSQKQVLFNKNLLPEGEMKLQHELPLIIGHQFLDDGFNLKEPYFKFKSPDYTFDLQFSSTQPNSYLQAYIPEHRKSIALEPLTCVPNCLNNGIGLQELEPGEHYLWKIQMQFHI